MEVSSPNPMRAHLESLKTPEARVQKIIEIMAATKHNLDGLIREIESSGRLECPMFEKLKNSQTPQERREKLTWLMSAYPDIMLGITSEWLEPHYAEAMREPMLKRLKNAKNAEDRVRVMATILDLFGVEVLIGTFFPAVGDMGVAGANFLYLVHEAKRAGIPLDVWQLSHFASLKAMDAGLGVVPVAGDLADAAYMSNIRALATFEANTNFLVKRAKEMGISQEEIDRIVNTRSAIMKITEVATGIAGRIQRLMPGSKSPKKIEKGWEKDGRKE